MTSTHVVTDASGAQTFSGKKLMGFDTNGMQTYLLNAGSASGPGVMHVAKNKEKPPRHDINVAGGVDAALAICIFAAHSLAMDEMVKND
jgi:hypothetical protein